MIMLQLNEKAISFTLPNQNGVMVSLDDFKGKKVILYFYPKDMTSGCTTQACSFQDHYQQFIDLNTVIIGISKDSVKSHAKFAEKYGLNFQLLSDESLEVIQAYDVWKEKKMCGKSYMGIVRTTFVFNEAHELIASYPKASPKNNAQQILELLAN